MRIDREWIERHIPHRGRMCLLHEVVEWDAESITCRAVSHRAADHPMRADGRLGIACGIEYAAQAMAVHGALVAGAPLPGTMQEVESRPDASARVPRAPPAIPGAPGAASVAAPGAGFLAAVRGVEFGALRLDDVAGDLLCKAVRVAGDGGTALYEFELRSAEGRLLRGRAAVVLDASPRLMPAGTST